ncbi:MAG: hypothetical protein N3A38_14830 [Planctomycetota bacterium]|nr:hypothetical protein [Planctomycetota bacterium]
MNERRRADSVAMRRAFLDIGRGVSARSCTSFRRGGNRVQAAMGKAGGPWRARWKSGYREDAARGGRDGSGWRGSIAGDGSGAIGAGAAEAAAGAG